MDDNRFMTIPPGAIIPGSLPKFKIYVRSPKGHHMLWARDGNEVTPKQLAKLTESGPKEVFITLEEELKYEEYLESHLGTILENKASSDEQKASIFSKVSTNVVKDAFENSLGLGTLSQDVLRRTDAMVQRALMFITRSGSLQALTKMIGHDYQTYEHATKVLWYTVAFLKENPFILERIAPGYEKLDREERMDVLKQCGVGALLHDIGKAFVSVDILNKNEGLTRVEWEIMKRHPLHGLAMLLDTEVPDFVKKAVLHHHEDFVGSGYPMGISGTNISLLARVLRIVDVFDAMTSRRPYKDPIPPGKAVQIMIGTPPESPPGQGEDGKGPGDRGMRRCFDEELLRKFIIFLGTVKLTS